MNLKGLRIAQIIDTLDVGGAERVTVDVSNMLVAQGVIVKLVVIRHIGPLLEQVDPKVQIEVLNFQSKTDLKSWRNLISALKENDLIHVHMRHTYGRVKLASILGRIQVPIIFHDHWGASGVPLYLKWIFKPEWYIGVRQESTLWAQDRLKINSGHIFCQPNTIYRSNQFNEEVDYKYDLLLVGNIRRIKNIEFAIQLANRLNLSLDIVGQVVDQAYYNELKDVCINGNVRFITDISDVFSILGCYRMALHTAISETGPLVLLEYLKAGLPFLSYFTGEVARQLKTIMPELVLEHFDLPEWELRLNAMLHHPPESSELQAIFHTHFGPEKYLQGLIKIYQCALAS